MALAVVIVLVIGFLTWGFSVGYSGSLKGSKGSVGFGNNSFGKVNQSWKDNETVSLEKRKELCVNSGGKWKMMPDSCSGTCRRLRNESCYAPTVIVEGCDCGEGRCYNGHTCEDI